MAWLIWGLIDHRKSGRILGKTGPFRSWANWLTAAEYLFVLDRVMKKVNGAFSLETLFSLAITPARTLYPAIEFRHNFTYPCAHLHVGMFCKTHHLRFSLD